jgi:hypothetical protein
MELIGLSIVAAEADGAKKLRESTETLSTAATRARVLLRVDRDIFVLSESSR